MDHVSVVIVNWSTGAAVRGDRANLPCCTWRVSMGPRQALPTGSHPRAPLCSGGPSHLLDCSSTEWASSSGPHSDRPAPVRRCSPGHSSSGESPPR